MARNHSLTRLTIAALLLACAGALALAGSAAAVTINGRVVNGTTGDEKLAVSVTLLNPSAGMAPIQEAQSVAGRFTFRDLDGGVPIYLVRVNYMGVLYSQMLRPEGRDVLDTTVSVYDTTTKWDGIHIVVPHLAALAHEEHLQIEALYEIHNHAEPPRTVAGEDAQFLIYIPEDKIEILRSFVSHGDVPLDRFPVPTDEPGVYRIDYPIRPGETSVGITYTVPYGSKTYSLAHKLVTDVENMTIFAVNPGMKLTSKTLTLGRGRPVHDMTAYDVANLTSGSQFELTIAGGGTISAAPGGASQSAGAGQPTVVILPSSTETVSTTVMVIVLLALIAFLGIATHGSVNPLKNAGQLQAYYTVMLKRMAKLDDLHETGMVAADVYRAKRAELKTQLAALRYQLHSGKGVKGRKGAERKVAGNERTSTP